MLQFEVVVVVVGLRAETNLLDDNLGGFGFLLFQALFLLIE